MAEEDNDDKPFEPTQKKLEDARRKGEIPRSTDLNTAVAYAGFLLADHLGWLHPAIPYRPDVLPSVLGLIATFVLVTACVMFMQWIFNLSLTGALDEAEQKHDELVQSQSLLAERADELGKANALLHKRTVQLQVIAQIVK